LAQLIEQGIKDNSSFSYSRVDNQQSIRAQYDAAFDLFRDYICQSLSGFQLVIHAGISLVGIGLAMP
jgi:hypothetical protein